jgi:hypothetical protein
MIAQTANFTGDDDDDNDRDGDGELMSPIIGNTGDMLRQRTGT